MNQAFLLEAANGIVSGIEIRHQDTREVLQHLLYGVPCPGRGVEISHLLQASENPDIAFLAFDANSGLVGTVEDEVLRSPLTLDSVIDMGDRVEAGETGLRDIFEENEKPADDARSTLPSSLGYTPRSCGQAASNYSRFVYGLERGSWVPRSR